MDKSLVIALVGAGASMVVAVTGLITATITNRQSAKNARSIELLRQSIAAASKTDEFSDAHLSAYLDSLKQGMQAIQSFKDVIQLILSAIEESLSSQEALLLLQKALDAILASFQAVHSNLNDTDRGAFHRAKGIAIEVGVALKHDLQDKKNAAALSATARAMLFDLRGQLTDVQNILRDSRTDRIVKRTLPQS